MENVEAKKIVLEMATALDKARWALDSADRNAKQITDQRKEIEKLKKGEEYFTHLIKMYEKLIRIYETNYGKRFEICVACNGEGGGYVDMGEQGGEGWECEHCKGTGILELTTATT